MLGFCMCFTLWKSNNAEVKKKIPKDKNYHSAKETRFKVIRQIPTHSLNLKIFYFSLKNEALKKSHIFQYLLSLCQYVS